MKLHDGRSMGWQEFTELISRRRRSNARLLVLAAHPDDESIGASVLLSNFTSYVAYLSDGAPRDSRLWTGGPHASREAYSALRRMEAARALRLAMISSGSIAWLGGTDQETVSNIGELTRKLVALLLELSPDLLVTHPYEGGHPDHDTASLVTHNALQQLTASHPPELIEMTSYHAQDGACVTGEFLPFESVPEVVIELSDVEKARKHQMLASHESQQVVLGRFRVDCERFRPMPDYDFTKAPHPGKLWYECMGWSLTGDDWRREALSWIAGSVPSIQSSSCG